MELDLSPVITAVVEQLSALNKEREELLSRVQQIDEKVARLARSLGVEPGQMASPTSHARRLARPDARSEGSMAERMRQMLLTADRGYTRADLRAELSKEPKFAEQISRNANSFYNNVIRNLKAGKMVEVDGHLYDPARAPADEPDQEGTTAGLRLVTPVRKFDL